MSQSKREQIGKYRITGTLGKGAMGVVYKGFDESIRRPVAIKVLHDNHREGAQGAELEQRFKQEAQAAARCLDPNIVTIFEYGLAEDRAPYIVMEYVEGVELKRYLRQRPKDLSIGRSVLIISQVLQALEFAHRHGVVHRDIKPSNILLMDDQQVKVMDFGVARLDSSDLTLAGYMVGTPSYMSPEGLQGARVDARSDIYTTGQVLLELLSGQKLKVGDDNTVKVPELLQTSIPPHPVRDALQQVIVIATAKDPADRYQTASQFLTALQDAMQAAVAPELEDDPTDYAQTVISPVICESAAQDSQTAGRSHSQQSSTSGSTQGSSMMLSKSLVKSVEQSLAKHVGPMAKVFVKRSMRSAQSLDEFTDTLAGAIPDRVERQQFVDQLRSSGIYSVLERELSQIATVTALSESSQSQGLTPYRFSSQTLKKLSSRLAYYVGPIAARYVKSMAKRSTSPENLKQQLAEKIPNKEERDAFLREKL